MKTTYFCTFHAERMMAYEGEAIQYWTQMMRRGTQAYSECRIDAARIYLGSAMEIGLLRHSCVKSMFFDDMHLTQPLSFLIELLILDESFDEAIYILSKISTAINERRTVPDSGLLEVLANHYSRVEISEKKHMTQVRGPRKDVEKRKEVEKSKQEGKRDVVSEIGRVATKKPVPKNLHVLRPQSNVVRLRH